MIAGLLMPSTAGLYLPFIVWKPNARNWDISRILSDSPVKKRRQSKIGRWPIPYSLNCSSYVECCHPLLHSIMACCKLWKMCLWKCYVSYQFDKLCIPFVFPHFQFLKQWIPKFGKAHFYKLWSQSRQPLCNYGIRLKECSRPSDILPTKELCLSHW